MQSQPNTLQAENTANFTVPKTTDDFTIDAIDIESILENSEGYSEDVESVRAAGNIDIDIIKTSLEYNIAYKEAEIRYYTASKDMKIPRDLQSAYRSMMRQDDTTGSIAILLRSVLNIDNTSIFNKNNKEYHSVIYQLVISVYEQLPVSEADITTHDTLVEDYKMCLGSLQALEEIIEDKEQPRDIRAVSKQEHKNMSKRLNVLIAGNQIMTNLYNHLRTIIPRLSTLRKFVVDDGEYSTKQNRDIRSNVQDLEDELQLMQDAVPGVVDKSAELQPTIFSEVTLPAYQDGRRGFRYKCGLCGTVHFTERIPTHVNHMPIDTSEEATVVTDTPTQRSTMAIVVSPVQCETCAAVNIFSKVAMSRLKRYILARMASKGYVRGQQEGRSELTLGNSDIRMLLENDITAIQTDDGSEDKLRQEVNPLDANTKMYLEDFVSFVKTNQRLGEIASNTSERNIRYLHLLFETNPSVKYAIDKQAAVISVLQSSEDNQAMFTQIAEVLHRSSQLDFYDEVISNLEGIMGDSVYKEYTVTPDILEHVTRLRDTIPAVNKEEVDGTVALMGQLSLESLGYTCGTIHAVSQDTRDLYEKSGVCEIMWPIVEPIYQDMLVQTITHVLTEGDGWTSPLFLGTTLKHKTPEAFNTLSTSLWRNQGIKPLLEWGSQTIPNAVHTVLATIMQISNFEMFKSVTKVDSTMLAQIEITPDNVTYAYRQKRMLESMTKILGNDLDFGPYLDGQTIVSATAMRMLEDRLDSEIIPNEEAAIADAHLSAYIFAHTIPTHTKALSAIKVQLLEEIESSRKEDQKRFEEWGLTE